MSELPSALGSLCRAVIVAIPWWGTCPSSLADIVKSTKAPPHPAAPWTSSLHLRASHKEMAMLTWTVRQYETGSRHLWRIEVARTPERMEELAGDGFGQEWTRGHLSPSDQ